MMPERPYRTLFLGTLRQKTALSVGGRDIPGSVADAPLCRDGQKRFTLRGQTLAGALIATARRLGTVPEYLSGSNTSASIDPPPPSRWRSFASHPLGEPKIEIRQHVCIDPRTGTAEEHSLFNIETLPAGVEWPFLLEVDSMDSDGATAEAIAWHALREWQAGRCTIGREVARGLGWMTLQNLQIVRLDAENPEHLSAWPDSSKAADYPNYVGELARRFGDASVIDLPPWDAREHQAWTYLEIPFTIHVGEKTDGYGLDSLSIGGHAESEVLATWDEDHFLSPASLRADQREALFDPDFALVMNGSGANRQPFIPGSALRGPLRHALERHYRASGDYLQQQTALRQFFGSLEDENGESGATSAALLVSDAEIESADWQAAWFQLHAEDEFTAGAFGSSKFDRLALVSGVFSGKLVLEARTDAIAQLEPLLEKIQDLAISGQVALGGGQWRGHGGVRWEFGTHRKEGAEQ